MELQVQNQIKIKIYNVVLNYIQNHNWANYDGFAEDFTDEIIEQFQKENFNIDKILDSTKGSFLQLNGVKKEQFLNEVFTNSLLKSWNKTSKYTVPVLHLTDIFPEISQIMDKDVKELQCKLNMDESDIQNAFRDALREKNATPIAQRGKDSSLEVADLEHFEMKVNRRDFGFSVVIKGYNSLPGKARWKDIAHQVTKAYRTHPDYVIVASAREPVDSLVTEMKTYSKDIGNPNLVMFIPPVDLAKFLKWQKII